MAPRSSQIRGVAKRYPLPSKTQLYVLKRQFARSKFLRSAGSRLGLAGAAGYIAYKAYKAYRKKPKMAYKRRSLRSRRRAKRVTKSSVRRMLNQPSAKRVEYTELSSITADVGTFNTYQVGTNISQDVTSGSRLGSKIRLSMLTICCRFVNPNTTVGQSAYARFALLKLKVPDVNLTTDTFKAQGDLNNPINYVVTGDTQQIHQAWNKAKFQVMWTKRFKLPIKTAENSESFEKLTTFQIPIGKDMTILSSAATTDTKTTPQLYLCWFFEGQNDLATFTLPLSYQMKIYTYFKT